MFLWFGVTSIVGTALIFRSPFLDYRLVAIGALLPVLETTLGFKWLLHTLIFSVGVLILVMLLGKGKRRLQRKFLPVPIGLLAHLVLDTTWTEKEIFWWPFTGSEKFGNEVSRLEFSFSTGLILEFLAIIIAVWGWKKFEMKNSANRSAFKRHGHLYSLRVN
ncbi:MAG: hypothetical protein VX476_05425 [Actinomycetota bacterium]|nr:hypothetical protein [Actinomycetota bacterium]MED5277336.1 hypothetical protein [Actinomycetota bacterium]|tara:strand:- start:18274 stop:18759 length:486 start_codon:yes stop_codon:yes gene_type:complete